MQITGSATNAPFKAPTEVDGQDRLQSSRQTQEQQSAPPPSTTDTVTVSPEAQALSRQQNVTDASLTTPEPPPVEPGRTVQDVGQAPQNTPAPAPAAEQATVTPPPADNAPVQTQTDNTAPLENTPAPTPNTATTQPPAQEPTIVSTNTAPQNTSTPQKQAPETPLAAVGGLSTGSGNIDLSV